MIAWKFLEPGAVAPFTRFRWPKPAPGAPGEWVDAPRPGPEVGVHACAVEHLPFWIGEELWRIELDGAVDRDEHQLVAPRGRLLSRVAAWDGAAAADLAAWCSVRARETAATSSAAGAHRDRLAGLAADAAAYGGRCGTLAAACAAYIAAVTAGAARPGGFAAERGEQARWLAARLRLEP